MRHVLLLVLSVVLLRYYIFIMVFNFKGSETRVVRGFSLERLIVELYEFVQGNPALNIT